MGTYSKRAISGHAAEYFVAYKVTKHLGWMCRLPGVDIGIDAEIEITDDKDNSIGRFIKVQIKGVEKFTKSGKKTFKPTQKQMNYWQDFAAPVIFCCVDHEKEEVYWKVIWMTLSDPAKLEFTRDDNVIDSSSKKKLQELVSKSSRNTIIESLETVRKFQKVYHGIHNIDIDAVQETELEIKEIKVAIDFLRAVAESFPWFIDPQTKALIENVAIFANRIRSLADKARAERFY